MTKALLFMLEAINTPEKVILFYLGVILIPQFVYFEISFSVRGKNYTPRMIESLIVGLMIGVGVVAFWLNYGGGGEGGLAVMAFSPIFVLVFTLIGLSVGLIYKSRKVSLFKKIPPKGKFI